MRGEPIRKPHPTLRGIAKLDAAQRERLLAMLKGDAPYSVIEERFAICRGTIKSFAKANELARRNTSRRWWL
jgi:hypothetical protein